MNEIVPIDFNNLAEMSGQDVRDLIDKVETECNLSTEQIDVPLQHYFSNAVYAREVTLPKGAIVIGKIHTKENLNILSSGEVSVLSIDGVKRVKAPHTFVSSPGVKRLVYAHTETVWTTIHGTSETDLDKIEDEFIAKNYDKLPLEAKEKVWLG